jgi:hypothetical protein
MATSVCLRQTENGKGKLLFVHHRRKCNEVCFPWFAIDKRLSTIAVSANVPIYVNT